MPPVSVQIQARQDTKANTISPALYNTVVGSRRHAHATELYRLHLFQLSKNLYQSPPGSSRLAPTLELLPGGACIVRVLYQTRGWLSSGASLALTVVDRNRHGGGLTIPNPADVGLIPTMPLAEDLAVPDVTDVPLSVFRPQCRLHTGVNG